MDCMRTGGQILYRKPLNRVDFLSLSAASRSRIETASLVLKDLRPIPAEAMMAASDSFFLRLHHPLSDAFVGLNNPPSRQIRSEREREGLEWLEKEYERDRDLFEPDNFPHIMRKLNFKLSPGRWGYRNGEISTSGDSQHNLVRFPSAANIGNQMQLLQATVTNVDKRPAVFVAAMLLAILTNCHPFRDGNGRTARTLFNYALRSGGMRNEVYVPFYEIASRSRGGYLIALRQAETSNEWEPFFYFVCELLNIHSAIQSCELR